MWRTSQSQYVMKRKCELPLCSNAIPDLLNEARWCRVEFLTGAELPISVYHKVCHVCLWGTVATAVTVWMRQRGPEPRWQPCHTNTRTQHLNNQIQLALHDERKCGHEENDHEHTHSLTRNNIVPLNKKVLCKPFLITGFIRLNYFLTPIIWKAQKSNW